MTATVYLLKISGSNKSYLLFRKSSNRRSSATMAGTAGGDVETVPGHCPGRPHQQEGAGQREAGEAQLGPG